MKWIRLSPLARSGRDIDLPDSVKHRSVQGSTIILVPGASREVTAEEWQFIQDKHSDLLPMIQLLG